MERNEHGVIDVAAERQGAPIRPQSFAIASMRHPVRARSSRRGFPGLADPSRDIQRTAETVRQYWRPSRFELTGVTQITIKSVPAPIYTLNWVSGFTALADGTARAY